MQVIKNIIRVIFLSIVAISVLIIVAIEECCWYLKKYFDNWKQYL